MPLIDNYLNDKTEIDGKWYVAKPMTYYSFRKRLRHAYLVLLGKREPIHFKEDE